MSEITLAEIWVKMFKFFGQIRLMDVVWAFNLLVGTFLVIVERKGFWKWFGWWCLVSGGLYIIIRIF